MTAITAVAYEIAIFFFKHLTSLEWINRGTELSFFGVVTNAFGMQIGWTFKDYKVNSVTWYVSVLLLCYILYYLICKISCRLKTAPYLLSVVMILIGVGIRTYGINLPFFNAYSARGYYSFFTGTLCGGFEKIKKRNRTEYIISSLVIFSILFLVVFRYSIMQDGFYYTMSFLFYPSLLFIATSETVNTVINKRIITYLSIISFDVYVWQLIGIILLLTVNEVSAYELKIESKVTMYIFVMIMFIVGALSYHYINKPLTKLVKEVLMEVKTAT